MENTEQTKKPFSMDYVIRTTVKHMRKSVDTSIRKTFDRIPEFDGNQEKSEEVFKTLAHLHSIKKSLDEFNASITKQ